MKSLRDFRPRLRRSGETFLVCLAACAHMLGRTVDPRSFKTEITLTSSVRRLLELAPLFGLSGRALHCELEDLSKLRPPCILQWGGLHESAVLERVLDNGDAILFFAADGRRRVKLSEIDRKFGGVAVEFTATSEWTPPPDHPTPRVPMFDWNKPVVTAVGKAVAGSLTLQCLALLIPLFIRIVADNIVVSGDENLLEVAAVGFAIVSVFLATATFLRALVISELNALLTWHSTHRVFAHLIRLPYVWFNGRHLADTLGRLQGLEQVRAALGTILVGIFDGVFSVLILFGLALLSPILALVSLLAFVFYAMIRACSLPRISGLNRELTLSIIAEQAKRMETCRAIQTIKGMAAETQRENDWRNRFAVSLNAQQRLSLWTSAFQALQLFVSTATTIVVIFLGTQSVLRSDMTIGMLMAALAYEQLFFTCSCNFYEQLVTWRALEAPLSRVQEILTEPQEDARNEATRKTHVFSGAIDARDLCFTYPGHTKTIIKNLNLTVSPGEHVAIIAPSGTGKSTLLKLLLGLYEPTAGKVRFDGISSSELATHDVRRALGAVLQNDELLSGTIEENIAFFADEIDAERVRFALDVAAILPEVNEMPSREQTLIGDQGLLLSGGQKQRLLIARAVYKNPSILILDEATSSLDVPLEHQVMSSLAKLSITRIVVSHRPQALTAADRVLKLVEGQLSEVGRTAPLSHEVAVRAGSGNPP